MKHTYLILPGCDDTNRGDQALIWESVEIAKESGYEGEYYMIASSENSKQSAKVGIENIEYVLPHPSTHFRNKSNIRYGKLLKLQWAIVSVFDGVKAVILLSKAGRQVAYRFGNSKLKKSLSIYEKAEIAFVKGGGFLHSYGGLVSTYKTFYDLYHIILAQKMGIKVYVMPNSYGPFKGIGTSWMIKKVLNKCEFVSSRESVSTKALKNIGVDCQQFPDLAFYLSLDADLSNAQKIKLEKIPFRDRKCVGITMRPYRFPGFSNPDQAYHNYKKVFCKFIKYLNSKGYFPVLIEHTYSDTEHERDLSCINDVVSMLNDSCEYAVYSDLSLNCRQLKYVYSQFDFIIGTRFHSVIFSLAAEVPSIALTYGGNKGEGIMKDIGLSEFAIPITDISEKKLIQAFEKLELETDEIKLKIGKYLDLLAEKRRGLLKQLRRE